LPDNSASACPRARRRSTPPSLLVQQRGLVDRGDLLEQILQVPLPVARLGGPREGARKGRVAPPVRHPRSMVEHPQGPRRLDEAHLGEIEVGDRKSTRLNSSHRTISYAV